MDQPGPPPATPPGPRSASAESPLPAEAAGPPDSPVAGSTPAGPPPPADPADPPDPRAGQGRGFYHALSWAFVAVAAGAAAVALLWGQSAGAITALVAGGLAALLSRAHATTYAFQYAYFCRQPVVLYLLTTCLPIIAIGPLRDFGENLFVLRARQAAASGLVLALVVFAQATTLRLILRASGTRNALPLVRGQPLLAQADYDYGWKWIVLGAVPALVWMVVLVRLAPHARLAVAASHLGAFALTFAFLWWLLRILGQRLDTVDPSPAASRLQRVTRALSAAFLRLGLGYRDHASSHLGMAMMMALSALFYVAGWFALSPPDPLWPAFPAIAYVLVWLLSPSWILPALSFMLDKYRVPVWLALVPVWLVLQAVSTPDQVYPLRPGTAATAPAATDLLGARLDRAADPENPRPLVVIAASGGGITASLWTASVLAGLQSDPGLGSEFARDIGLVSTASGGSVGAMFYLHGFDRSGPPADPWRFAEAAGTSSLAATAWGLVYPDFIRAVTGFFPLDDNKGRGWANERVWSKLAGADETLGGWMAGVAEGWRPIQIFNATEVESGAAVQLAAARLPDAGAGDALCCDPERAACRARAGSTSLTWAPGRHDLGITTAARLSATFPYVFPVARARTPDGRRCGNHLADGGYYDNYGVHAAVELLDRVLAVRSGRGAGAATTPAGLPHILVVQIEAFPEAVVSAPIAGWKGVTLGPLITLLGVRSASQADRNATELRLLRERWADAAHIEAVRFQLAPRRWPAPADGGQDGGCPLGALVQACAAAADEATEVMRAQDLPTSWQLSCAEKRAIICHWTRGAGTRQALERLRDIYRAGRGAQ